MLLFPAEPYAGRVPDAAYEAELQAAQELGLPSGLLDFEALLEGNLNRALRWVPQSDAPRLAVYRGWMLRPEQYAELYEGLQEHGWHLINSPAQYIHTHHLPQSFSLISPLSPRTVWLAASTPEDIDWAGVQAMLETFGTGPLVVKDYVKSRKHEWAQACFIPDAAVTEQAMQVIETFVARQGSEFQGGLVLRAFESFGQLSPHSKSGMPLTREYRLFFLDSEVVATSEYWEEGDYSGQSAPLDLFRPTGQRVQSRLFTMDVAQRTDGEWRVVELGDGQVAGLPERMAPGTLVRALAPLLFPRD